MESLDAMESFEAKDAMESCDAVDALLPLFVSGRLHGADRARLALHLAACEACREELGRLFRLRSQVEALAAAHAPTPAQLERVLERIKADPAFAARSNRLDLRDWIPFGEFLQPVVWAQRIVDGAERLRAREWTISVRPFGGTPVRES